MISQSKEERHVVSFGRPRRRPRGGCVGPPPEVARVPRPGRRRFFPQGNNANPNNIELARRKAYTARTFRQPSAQWAKNTETQNGGQRMLAGVIPLGGGTPVHARS